MRRILFLPGTYARDRDKRGLPMGEVLREGAKTWTIQVDAATLAHMIADARHYAEGGMDEAPVEVVRSAKTALAKLLAI